MSHTSEEAESQEGDGEDACHEPCDPKLNRPCCAEYWDRMVREGFWDMERHRWTDKGWREITK